MTTIAYDGHQMAADSACTGSFQFHLVNPKIRRFRDSRFGPCIAGTADHLQDSELFFEWLVGTDKDKPSMHEHFTALVVTETRLLGLDDKLVEYPVSAPFAIGSGELIAMGAMYAGAGAKESVEISIKLDSGSGGDIISIDVSELNTI